MLSPYTVARPLAGLSGLSVSVAAHVTLVSLALVYTQRPPALTHDVRDLVREHVVFTQPARLLLGEAGPAVAHRLHAAVRRASHRRAVADAAQPARAEAVSLERPGVAIDAPELDIAAPGSESRIAFVSDESRDQLQRALGTIVPEEIRATAYEADEVERVAWPAHRNPLPVYPSRLLRDRVEGRLLVIFVVDTTGLVEAGSVTTSAGAHPLFAESVRWALLHSRYDPARLGGHPVKQRVEQAFEFRLAY